MNQPIACTSKHTDNALHFQIEQQRADLAVRHICVYNNLIDLLIIYRLQGVYYCLLFG